MAYTACKEQRGRRECERDRDGRRYTRIYHVTCEGHDDSEYDLWSVTDLPVLGDTHPSDSGARVSSIRPRLIDDGGRVWEVAVQWDTKFQDQEENPLLRPAVFTWTLVKDRKPYTKDADDVLVANSAGDLFFPPDERDESRLHLEIEKNQPDFDAGIAIDYADTVNSDGFFGAAVETVKCEGISGTGPQQQNGITYWSVRYSFDHRRDKWDFEPLDAGFFFLGPLGKSKICDALWQPVNTPQYLDGHGARSTTPHYLRFKRYPRRAFSGLGLA